MQTRNIFKNHLRAFGGALRPFAGLPAPTGFVHAVKAAKYLWERASPRRAVQQPRLAPQANGRTRTQNRVRVSMRTGNAWAIACSARSVSSSGKAPDKRNCATSFAHSIKPGR